MVMISSEMGLIVLFRCLLIALFSTSIFLSSACTFKRKDLLSPLQVVPHVDLKRYVGTWHEIARYPHRFQEGCAESSATYTLLENGKIGVLNQCRKGPDQKLSSAKGKAWVVDKETNAKLKVSFVWPFSGDYWIIDLDPEYRWAMVGEPGRDYLWILSREPQLDMALYQQIVERAKQRGFDTGKLVKTRQVSARLPGSPP